MKPFLQLFNQSAKKLDPATLEGATPYLNTEPFLPTPWNHMTHGVHRLSATGGSGQWAMCRLLPALVPLSGRGGGGLGLGA